MAEQTGARIKVTLRWIQILDKMEPAWKEKGEFRFQTRVSAAGQTQEFHFPETISNMCTPPQVSVGRGMVIPPRQRWIMAVRWWGLGWP